MGKENTEKQTKEVKKLPTVNLENYNFKPSFVFGKEGPIAKDLSEYQVRQPQIILAEHIQTAFSEKKHLIAEAGTGTGKSFANLLGAIEKSLGSGLPVVISTHTIALQEQLCDKDVPFMLKQLGLKNVKVTLAKGRGNYVSIRRARLAIKDGMPGAAKLEAWLDETSDGTLASIPFKPDPLVWNRSRSDPDQCLGEHCKTYEQCFFQRSRKRLTESHLIITNHNLVLLDRKMKQQGLKGVLPDYKYLIIDEAHELENVARQVLTFEYKQKDLASVLFELRDGKGTGFLDLMYVDSGKDILGSSILNTEADRLIKTALDTINDALEENDKFFRNVSKYLGKESLKRITQKEVIKTNLLSHLNAIIECLKLLTPKLEVKDNKLACEYAIKKCNEFAIGLTEILTLPDIPGKDYPNTVAWATSSGGKGNKSYMVVAAPIFLKNLLRSLLFKPLDSVVMTSATLASGGNDPFRMLKSNLGIDNPIELRLPPVFDYENQARIAIVTNMPEQKESNYVDELAKQVKKFVKISNGGAFVLFTSFKVMNGVYNLTKDSLEFLGCKLFVQGGNLTRNQMIDEFKKTNKGVLFGVSSFWTGVDIPGNALRNIIITKLPFPSPADPLMQAQDEIYKKFKKNFFIEKSVPMTAIMLKQGFGRLIRKTSDKGLVVILDSRIVTKKYGGMLLSALPKCPTKKLTIDA